jgi:hypothetical protein
VLLREPVENAPGNQVEHVVENDILMTHGVAPARVQMIRNPLETIRINAMRPIKQKLNRTAVGLSRP